MILLVRLPPPALAGPPADRQRTREVYPPGESQQKTQRRETVRKKKSKSAQTEQETLMFSGHIQTNRTSLTANSPAFLHNPGAHTGPGPTFAHSLAELKTLTYLSFL
mmetsp:Transcript_28462/g.111550  ORF Transcript_28462/g.111550 Transcript_28462/m.111550 type:complete len:107 (-) Transcript_28462:105-425(-)